MQIVIRIEVEDGKVFVNTDTPQEGMDIHIPEATAKKILGVLPKEDLAEAVIIPATDEPKEEVSEVVIKKVAKEVKEVVRDIKREVELIRNWATDAIQAGKGDELKVIMAEYGLKKLSDAEDHPEILRDLFDKVSDLTKVW